MQLRAEPGTSAGLLDRLHGASSLTRRRFHFFSGPRFVSQMGLFLPCPVRAAALAEDSGGAVAVGQVKLARSRLVVQHPQFRPCRSTRLERPRKDQIEPAAAIERADRYVLRLCAAG
jgi:hypothetical protein